MNVVDPKMIKLVYETIKGHDYITTYVDGHVFSRMGSHRGPDVARRAASFLVRSFEMVGQRAVIVDALSPPDTPVKQG